MYTVSHRPSKLIVKTRRGEHFSFNKAPSAKKVPEIPDRFSAIPGITQKVDNLESPTSVNRDTVRSGSLSFTADMSSPKPVFHQVNGRRSQSQKSQQETYTPEHLEIINYIQGMWTSVCNEYESSKHSSEVVPKVVYYQDSSTNQHLQNFQPFDLEAFWGERFLQRIKQDT